jgi:hypothetical protein
MRRPWLGGVLLVAAGAAYMTPVMVLVVVVSAALVAVDSTWKDKSDRVVYTMGVLLLWILIYPPYLHERGKAGRPKRLAVGLASIGTLAFCFAWSAGVAANVSGDGVSIDGRGVAEVHWKNQGWMPGAGCISIKLTRTGDGGWKESEPLCSGRLAPGESRKQTFDDAMPGAMAFCLEEPGASILKPGAHWYDRCPMDTKKLPPVWPPPP